MTWALELLLILHIHTACQQACFLVDSMLYPLCSTIMGCKKAVADAYAVPGDHTSQMCAYSIQAVLLNLAVICDHKVGGICLQQDTLQC